MPVRLQDELLKQLERNGWSVTRQKGEPDWRAWFHEIWVLDSRWSPHGFTLFLAFLTDPEPGNANPFYIVGTSVKHPENRFEADGEPRLEVTPAWVNELPQFVADLNGLRRCGTEKSPGESSN
jgi:hypothetical protein